MLFVVSVAQQAEKILLAWVLNIGYLADAPATQGFYVIPMWFLYRTLGLVGSAGCCVEQGAALWAQEAVS